MATLTPGSPDLRRLVLAVAVLHDVDVEPGDDGVTLPAPSRPAVRTPAAATSVDWAQVHRAAGHPDDDEGVRIARLAAWLKARQALLGGAHLHVRGLTAGDSPAAHWIRERVPGGAVLLGFGYGDERRPLPDGVLAHAGIDGAVAWRSVRHELETTGALAASMDRRRRNGPLRPVSGADVVTLLGADSLRAEIAASERTGLAALIVPMRVRGWRANGLSDPAFGAALAAAMPPEERAFTRPLLVSAHQVSEAPQQPERLAG
jgi:hypothetical protein